MWNKAKQVLNQCLNILLAVILLLGCVSYIGIGSVIATSVINDLRLDTYVGYETGCGIVLLVLLLGWGPVWIMRTFSDRH